MRAASQPVLVGRHFCCLTGEDLMQNRRDHVHAHRFAVSRLADALITGSPGDGMPPLRRAGFGTALGVMVGVLICGGTVVYSLIKPAPSTAAWQKSGAVVVEKETGSRFVYLDGELHPLPNYASAVLLAGGTPTVNYLASSALTGVPQGQTVGILGAPDSLPAASALLAGKWAVCLQPSTGGGAASSAVTLILGSGGQGKGLGEQRLLVAGPDGSRYVIFGNVSYPLTTRSAQVALGFGNTAPLSVPATWLATLPTGPALVTPAIAQAGSPGPAIAGRPTQVGKLFDSTSGGVDQHYILLHDGLAPVSQTLYALFAAASSQDTPTSLTAAEVAEAPASTDLSMLGMLPDLLAGTVYQPGAMGLCVHQAAPGGTADDTLVDLSGPVPSGATPGVIVPSGAGMLAQGPAAADGTATEYLITDAGEKYPLTGDAASDFGYQGATPQSVPAAILVLVPTGPTLSPDLADKAVSWESS